MRVGNTAAPHTYKLCLNDGGENALDGHCSLLHWGKSEVTHFAEVHIDTGITESRIWSLLNTHSHPLPLSILAERERTNDVTEASQVTEWMTGRSSDTTAMRAV